MAIEVGDGEFAGVLQLPDITHDATAVAMGVNVQQEDRKVGDTGRL